MHMFIECPWSGNEGLGRNLRHLIVYANQWCILNKILRKQ